jgi:hypothetical protein
VGPLPEPQTGFRSSGADVAGGRVEPGLTEAQVAFFHQFGFVHLPGFLAEVEAVSEAFDQVFAEHAPVESFAEVHFGGCNRALPALVDLHPTLTPLKTDPRVLGVVRSLIPGEYEYRESGGNVYECDTSWHCDIYDSPLDQFHIKFLFYLDPADAATGALRVIPGTNHAMSDFARSLRRDLEPWMEIEPRLGIEPEQVPCWPVPTRPGDLVVLNFRTIHGTFGGPPGRRLLTLNYRATARPS